LTSENVVQKAIMRGIKEGAFGYTAGSAPTLGPNGKFQVMPQTQVELTFNADRNQLFEAWNAVANLADLAGTVTLSIHAEKPDGFDKSKLHNGVMEPLREADLIE
jgi:hypothetical protein